MPREDEEQPQDAPPQEVEAQEDAPEAPPEGDAPPEEGAPVEEGAPPEQPAEEGGEGDQPPAEGEGSQELPPPGPETGLGYFDDAAHQAFKKAERDRRLAETQQLRADQKAAFGGRTGDMKAAIDGGKQVIHLTRTFDCHEDAWCTHHKEEKYNHFESLLKAAVAKDLGENYYVAVNCKQLKKVLGAFEVEYKDACMFSKLESQYWPCISMIIDKVRAKDAEESG